MYVSECGRIIQYNESEVTETCPTCRNLNIPFGRDWDLHSLSMLIRSMRPETCTYVVDNPPEKRSEYHGNCPFCAFVLLAMRTLYRPKEPFFATMRRHEQGWSLKFLNWNSSLQIYTPSTGYLPLIPYAPIASEVSHHAADESAWRFIKSQLDDCLQHHPECWSSRQHYLPKRLVKIVTGETIKIINAQELALSRRYCTLSHCWGGKNLLSTTSSNLASRFNAISWEDLPPVFQDAFTVARRIGVDYIWIDSLCIIQDDPDDWAEQAAAMADIYENAFVTIAATASPDSERPFLVPRPWAESFWNRKGADDWPLKNVRLICHTAEGQTKHLHARQDVPFSGAWSTLAQLTNGEVDLEGPLMQRGWAWQEKVLSNRYLSFGRWATTWQCQTIGMQDNGRPCLSLDRTRLNSIGSAATLVSTWHDIVRQYSGLALSYEKDRLPALAGAASRIATSPSDYFAGAWRLTLEADLTWFSPAKTTLDSLRTTAHRIPSWSWASVPRKVDFYTRTIGINSSRIQVLKTQRQVSTLNLFGEVESASIKLKGAIIPGLLKRVKRGNRFLYIVRHKKAEIEYDFHPDCQLVIRRCQDEGASYYCPGRGWDRPCCEEETPKFSACRINLLLLASGERSTGRKNDIEIVLVLGHPAHDHSKFERLGILSRIVHGQHSWFTRAERKEITLV